MPAHRRRRSTACATCHGTGAKPGTAPKVCPRCQGRGVESQGQGLFSISQPCSRCGGAGTVIEDPCPTCHGAGAVRDDASATASTSPPGVKRGLARPARRQGRAGPQRRPVRRPLRDHARAATSPVFKRKGDNVEVEVPLTIPEAIRGAEVEVPTLHGSQAGCASPPGTQHGTVQRLRGEGPPKLGAASGRGRHPLPLRHRRPGEPQRGAVRGGREALAGDERQPAREAVRAGASGGRDGARAARRTTRVTVDRDRGVFMISVAAELADMHPQTLRMYEPRGLIEPQRSPKGTRLYSQADVERLRRIQEMTTELGLNLAGVERVLELEEQLERATPRGSRRSSGAAARCARRWRRRSSRCAARSGPSSSRTRLDRPRARAGHRAGPHRGGIAVPAPRRRATARRRPTPRRRRLRRRLSAAARTGARGARRARATPVARSSSPRVVRAPSPSGLSACSSAARRPGWPGGRSCGLISSCASGVSPAAVSLSGMRCALGSGSFSSDIASSSESWRDGDVAPHGAVERRTSPRPALR